MKRHEFMTQPGMAMAAVIAVLIAAAWLAAQVWPDFDWALRGAAVTITLGAGSIAIVQALCGRNPSQ